MRRVTLFCIALAAVLVLALPVIPAWAQNTVSYVSGSGDTNLSNNCSDASNPCASFLQALNNTADKGTVMCVGNGVVDGGGTTISKSITIDCGTGSFLSLGVMTIDGTGIIVRLRNLSFDGTGIAYGGNSNFAITVAHVAELYLENCRIHNFAASAPGIGINFTPGGSSRSRLTVADSVITEAGPTLGTGAGIFIQPTGSGLTQVMIERTRIEQSGVGIQANGGSTTGQIQIQVKDSILANNATGVAATSGGGLTVVSLATTQVTGNQFGVAVFGSQTMAILDRTTIQANASQAVSIVSGGVVFSYDNNSINNNGSLGNSPGVIALH
jgi:hypothetical protein